MNGLSLTYTDGIYYSMASVQCGSVKVEALVGQLASFSWRSVEAVEEVWGLVSGDHLVNKRVMHRRNLPEKTQEQ